MYIKCYYITITKKSHLLPRILFETLKTDQSIETHHCGLSTHPNFFSTPMPIPSEYALNFNSFSFRFNTYFPICSISQDFYRLSSSPSQQQSNHSQPYAHMPHSHPHLQLIPSILQYIPLKTYSKVIYACYVHLNTYLCILFIHTCSITPMNEYFFSFFFRFI